MEQHVELWNRCLTIIKDNISESMYDTWFAHIVPLNYENNNFTIQVPSQFFYEYIEEQFAFLLHQTLKRVIGQETQLLYRIKIDANSITLPPENNSVVDNTEIAKPIVTPFTKVEKSTFESQLNRNYNFANYIIVGKKAFAK